MLALLGFGKLSFMFFAELHALATLRYSLSVFDSERSSSLTLVSLRHSTPSHIRQVSLTSHFAQTLTLLRSATRRLIIQEGPSEMVSSLFALSSCGLVVTTLFLRKMG